MTNEQLIHDLLATFPGIAAELLTHHRHCNWVQHPERGVLVRTGEAEMGGLPIYASLACPDPDEYNASVLHAFERWIESRGYELIEYDAGVLFATPVQLPLAEHA